MPLGRRPPRVALERMAAALTHRGGDDCGIEIIGTVGLVNARLAILDPSEAGHQPMSDPDGRWLLTYNGEIYDHIRLRSELPAFPYRGHSDTESLLRALCAIGPSVVERCNGPFALAALDRDGHRLILARDRFGVKPLYVARHDGALWVASEIRALLAAGVPPRPRRDVLAHAVGRGIPIGSATPIEGIERVLPGTTVGIDLETLAATERTWFEPADAVDPELGGELAALGRAEVTERVEEALRTAVRRRLMADVPVGTLCSGGVDSSLVTALARDERPSIVAFTTALPDARRADETLRAQRAASVLGVELKTVTISARDWRRELVAAVRDHEYPLSASSSIPVGAMARAARSRGVKVVLTGEGADELFGGYSFLHHRQQRAFLPARTRLFRAVERARVDGARSTAASLLRRLRRDGASDDLGALQPAPAVVRYQEARAAAAMSAYAHHRESRRDLEAAMLAGLSSPGFAYLLNRMDKDAMASTVETRLPFLDPDVVALAVNLPLELRTGPRTKPLLRDAARCHLPRDIAERPKQPGLVLDGRRWVEEAARLEFLLEGRLREVLGVPAAAWQQLVQGASRRAPLRLWTGEIWCRLLLEGQRVEQVEEALWRPVKA